MSPDTPYADATSSPRPSGLVGPVTILSAGKTTRQAFRYDLRGRLVKTGGFSHSSLEYPLDPTLEGYTFTYDDRARMTRDSRDDTRFGCNYLGSRNK